MEATNSPPPARPAMANRVTENPVVMKELRGRMRGGRAFIMITIYLLLLSCIVSLVYFGFVASTTSTSVMNANNRQTMGRTIFYTVIGMEMMMISFIAPALTSGAISGEREHQTYDLLRTTLLPAPSLVIGKLFSALSFVVLLLFAAFPVQSLALIFGGVSISQVLVSFYIMLVTALTFASLGLFFSSFIRRTLTSSVVTYATSITLIFGIPMLLFAMLIFFESIRYNNPTPIDDFLEVAIFGVGWFLVSSNPLSTLLVTELILYSEQTLVYTPFPLPNSGLIFPLISPWISFGIIYTLLSIIFILLSIHFVRRVER